MPSSYSPNLKIELIAVGEQTDAWGSTTNDNFENVFEEAITGMATATFPSDADYNWAASYVNSVGSQAQRNLVIEVTGTISTTKNFIVPTIQKQYLVHNNTLGGQSIVVKTSAGTGITIPNGQRAHLYVNGTDVISVVDYFPSLRVGSATLDSALPIASGGTGQTTANDALNALLPSQGGNAGEYLTTDGTNSSWAPLVQTTFSAGTTGFTPNTPTSGSVVLAGTLSTANGGSGRTDLSYPTGPDTVAGIAATQTLTNKRITKRVSSTSTFGSTLSWNSDSFDQYIANLQNANLTFNADSGTPTSGQVIVFRIKDDGIARTLTWTTGSSKSFRAVGTVLPTTTISNKVLYVGAIYNTDALRWDVVAVSQEV